VIFLSPAHLARRISLTLDPEPVIEIVLHGLHFGPEERERGELVSVCEDSVVAKTPWLRNHGHPVESPAFSLSAIHFALPMYIPSPKFDWATGIMALQYSILLSVAPLKSNSGLVQYNRDT
jgi:hypothetical protein